MDSKKIKIYPEKFITFIDLGFPRNMVKSSQSILTSHIHEFIESLGVNHLLSLTFFQRLKPVESSLLISIPGLLPLLFQQVIYSNFLNGSKPQFRFFKTPVWKNSDLSCGQVHPFRGNEASSELENSLNRVPELDHGLTLKHPLFAVKSQVSAIKAKQMDVTGDQFGFPLVINSGSRIFENMNPFKWISDLNLRPKLIPLSIVKNIKISSINQLQTSSVGKQSKFPFINKDVDRQVTSIIRFSDICQLFSLEPLSFIKNKKVFPKSSFQDGFVYRQNELTDFKNIIKPNIVFAERVNPSVQVIPSDTKQPTRLMQNSISRPVNSNIFSNSQKTILGNTDITKSNLKAPDLSFSDKALVGDEENDIYSDFVKRYFYFPSIRIHTDFIANSLAQSFNADALTVGRDIFFASGKFNLSNPEGMALLGHEITHVKQQEEIGRPFMKGGMNSSTYQSLESQALTNENTIYKFYNSKTMLPGAPQREAITPFFQGKIVESPNIVSPAASKPNFNFAAVPQLKPAAGSSDIIATSFNESIESNENVETSEISPPERDIDEIVEKVYLHIKKKLTIERERRGKWVM